MDIVVIVFIITTAIVKAGYRNRLSELDNSMHLKS